MPREGSAARRWMRRWGAPLMFFATVAGLAVAFRDIALLFFVAVLIVYLIEPIVVRLTGLAIRGRALPRAGAVLLVYTAMIGSTLGFGAVVVPQLAAEAAGLAAEVPQLVQRAGSDYLPRLAVQVDQFRSALLPSTSPAVAVSAARTRVGRVVNAAANEAVFAAELSPVELDKFRRGAYRGERAGMTGPVLLRLRTTGTGVVEVLPGDEGVVLRRTADDAFVFSSLSSDADTAEPTAVDLHRAFTENIGGALETSGARVTEMLQVSQRLVGKLLSIMMSVFVTFMVAAFISIDVPRIVAFVLGLFSDDDAPVVARLLARLNFGLSGVIRGQLAICAINGVLTGIGLVLLDVKFAVLLAFIATVLSLIPIFGAILSTIPAVLIALTQSFTTALLVLAWILVIHFIEANLLNPKVLGSAARIHPAIVIFALLAGEHTYGIVGALVAVPVASIVQNLFIFARGEYGTSGAASRSRPPAQATDGEDT